MKNETPFKSVMFGLMLLTLFLISCAYEEAEAVPRLHDVIVVLELKQNIPQEEGYYCTDKGQLVKMDSFLWFDMLILNSDTGKPYNCYMRNKDFIFETDEIEWIT